MTGRNAYEQTRASATIKLKKKVGGKSSLAKKDQREPNYTKASDWLHLPVKDSKKIDTFYIYPSAVSGGATELLSIDDEAHRNGAQTEYYDDATVFEYDTNVYSPYYRQTDGNIFAKKSAAELDKYQRHEQKKDIFDSLDLYFTKYNNGKPFILAGTQQGAEMVKIVLKDYMKRHPAYKKRLVAVYEDEVEKAKVDTDVTEYGSSHGIDLTTDKAIEILYTNDVHCGCKDRLCGPQLYP